MSERTTLEDWLLALWWGYDQLTFPSLSRLFESYESWEFRKGLRHRLRYLEQKQLLVREKRAGQLVYRLTAAGRLHALGGGNPGSRWDRAWDGQWRMVLFDLPLGQQRLRRRLLRWLRQTGFGYLQQSVWVSPEPVDDLRERLAEFRDDVECFVLVESRVCSGYTDQAIVRGAWDFEAINRCYQRCLEVDADVPRATNRGQPVGETVSRWLRLEREAWQCALAVDPLLPRRLWPSSYLGGQAWQMRQKALSQINRRFSRVGEYA